MAEHDPLETAHSAVHAYLATLQTLSGCLGQACPPVGAPYRHRLARLQTRLSFDSSKGAIEESTATVQSELRGFANQASQYLTRSTSELRRAVLGLESIARRLTQRQDAYSERLRQFALEIESTPQPVDVKQLEDLLPLQAASLLSYVESMRHDTHSLSTNLRELLAEVGHRLAETEVTDPATGFMNRIAMERTLSGASKAVPATGAPVERLCFRVDFEAGPEDAEEIMGQAAARLSADTRPTDLLSRWGDREFLVLFQGSAEAALHRAGRIARALTGPYTLPSGHVIPVTSTVDLDGVPVEKSPVAR